jgi:hypothetical protein
MRTSILIAAMIISEAIRPDMTLNGVWLLAVFAVLFVMLDTIDFINKVKKL